MNHSIRLTIEELFVTLDREFRRRRPRECGACYVALPYRVDVEGDVPNWELPLALPCELGCPETLDELVSELQARYRLTMEERP